MRTPEQIIQLVKGTTKVMREGVELNIQSIDYIIKNNIEGAIVECGVWRGGSIAAMMYRLCDYNATAREIYLFDTFAGMTEPTKVDMKYNSQEPAKVKFDKMQRQEHNEWCFAELNEVKKTMKAIPYPSNKINYVVGDVLKTTGAENIPKIAVLRIDVDFYEGTKACLESLYSSVVKGGIIILDDYGIWDGAKKATKEFIDESIELKKVKHNRWFYKP